MWLDKIDWNCYNEGAKAWDLYIQTDRKGINPYKPNSLEWMSWNRGWNQNYNGL